MSTIEGVVSRLDIRRAQVLVEAVIVEGFDNKVNEVGVRRNIGSMDHGLVAGCKSSIRGNTIDSFPGSPAQGLSLGFFSDGALRALVRALSIDDSVNILFAPNLTTLDNEGGKIVVSQNVPCVTGNATSAWNPSTNPFQTIERQEVGITL
jgi:general secretion pathway protein D